MSKLFDFVLRGLLGAASIVALGFIAKGTYLLALFGWRLI